MEKDKNLLHFTMEIYCLRKNISVVQNQWHKRMDMAYKEPVLSGTLESLYYFVPDVHLKF